MPRFSVLVPTRDRPDLLAFCLEALAAQTFEDFEVIVSDNPTRSPVKDVFERWSGPGWRYLRQEKPVAMHDNFERGCAEARGEYVAVVIDKTILHPSALAVAHEALRAEPADIVTWRNDGYTPVDESRDVARGRFRASAATVVESLYDPAAELTERFANRMRRGTDPVNYVRAKIVFGAYSRRLLDRIVELTGRVFYPLAPDYTSMVPACVLADSAVDVGRPLLVSYNSGRSNGRQQSIDPGHARRFVETAGGPAIVGSLPVPGVYASHHNVVAYDLVSSAARCPPGTTPPLDFANLLRRVREDLDAVGWTDPAERDAQYAILERAEDQHGIDPEPGLPEARRTTKDVLAETLVRFPRTESLAYRAARVPHPAGELFTSPLDAARAADEHYSVGARS